MELAEISRADQDAFLLIHVDRFLYPLAIPKLTYNNTAMTVTIIDTNNAKRTFIAAGVASFNSRLGFIINQANIARTFIVAANKKNELAVPVTGAITGIVTLATKNGKAIALTAAPILPTMFMAAETDPERDPPMSMQNAQLGLSVISTPKVASAKHAMNNQTELAWET